MGNAQIEPFAGFHFRARLAGAFLLQSRDEGMGQVLGETSGVQGAFNFT